MIAPISRRNSCAAIRATVRPIRRRNRCRTPIGEAGSLRSPTAGGWSFALDPDLPADAAPALWQPRACAFVAIAEPAADGFAAARLADLVGEAEVAAEMMSHEEWHLVLLCGGRRYRLWVRHCIANEPLAYVSPADSNADLRLALASALQRLLVGGARTRQLPAGRSGPTEHWRLVQWLRLLDAMAEGASAREIAAALILEEAETYSSAEWDGSAERRRIARWQRAAVAMRDGGYRALLGA